MFADLQYAYLIGDLILGAFWLALLLTRRDLLKEMVTVGLLMGSIALLVAPLFYDYWRPEYVLPFGFEEFLYGFFAGGVASALYDVLYGKRFAKRRDRRHHSALLFILVGLLAGSAFLYLRSVGLGSIYSSAILLLLCGIFTLALRRDLFVSAVVSGVTFALCTGLFFEVFIYLFPTVVNAWWNVDALTWTNELGYPAEELLWAFAFGFSVGPLYKFLAGHKFARYYQSPHGPIV